MIFIAGAAAVIAACFIIAVIVTAFMTHFASADTRRRRK